MRRSIARLILASLVIASSAPAVGLGQPGGVDTALVRRIKERYVKREVRIRVRDGVQLFTSIYIPRDSTRRYPVLMSRTPYSVGPYGADYKTALGPSGNPRWVNDGYIFVYQDVRGRYYSEGTFRDMTPILERHDKPTDVDEGTDAYDTIDWLVKNLPTNGRVGIYGTSYPGFYTTASCLSRHPALVACSPQAPMTDIWMGDDNFHGGAFLLAHNFSFYTRFGRTPRPQPGPDASYPFSMGTPDAFKFYLGLEPLGPGTRKVMDSATAPLWQSILTHPAYDAFWKARDVRPHLHDVKAAVLTVGGFYDTEDIHGPWWVFENIERMSSATDNHVIVGPWSHGGWSRGDDDALGTLRWTYKTGPFFRDSIEYPFFAHHLAGAPDPKLAAVTVFRTGGDRWDGYDAWPPKASTPASIYLQPNGKLAFTPPASGAAQFDEYVSDPAKPVPTVERVENNGMPRDYITADQRFASRRTDVLNYQTDALAEDVTLTGWVTPVLHVSTSGTDADFIVKLIDAFPDSAANWPGDATQFPVGGYQQLVRGEPFRARYRRSFEKPLPMVSNAADSIRFDMPPIHHTFRRGHRIMVQIQSTWFPHIDLNPQRFVPNVFEAKPADFQKATMRVYHTPAKPTRLELRRLVDSP
jgi:putative CocE/NonD family hydrolase